MKKKSTILAKITKLRQELAQIEKTEKEERDAQFQPLYSALQEKGVRAVREWKEVSLQKDLLESEIQAIRQLMSKLIIKTYYSKIFVNK